MTGGNRKASNDRFFSARDRLRARPFHRRPKGCQTRRGDRPAQPLAPPAARRPDARRGAAQEHPDDRADRLRQDRDFPPPRQARGAPFLKVEATKFTEVGYVGRDVEQIVRDLVENGDHDDEEEKRKSVHARAQLAAEERVLDALVGATGRASTRDSFRKRLRAGELDDKEIEIEIAQAGRAMPMFELPNMPGSSIGAISIGDIFGKALGNRAKPRRTTVKDAHAPLIVEESDKMIDQDQIVQEAIREVENNGIVFLDEIDKICAREGVAAAMSRARACNAICFR